MSTLKVNTPIKGSYSLPVALAQVIELLFDTQDVSFSRSDNNVVIDFPNRSTVTLENFFANADEEGEGLPFIKTENSPEVSGGEFLQKANPEINITTAAGMPQGSSMVQASPALDMGVTSGGSGDYADDMGDIISGVDRLGSLDRLGANQWSNSSGTLRSPATFAGTKSEESAEPAKPAEPALPADYEARAIVYSYNNGDSSLRFRLLDADGKPVDATGATVFTPVSSEEGFFDLTSPIINADGSISFALSAAGQSAVANAVANAGGYTGAVNLFDYVTFEYDGRQYTMQVVLNQSGTYSPADALADGRVSGAGQEWHSQNQGYITGQRQGTDGNDEVWFKEVTGNREGYGFYNNTLNMGNGNNTLNIYGDGRGIFNANVITGNGTDKIDIGSEYIAVFNGSIDTGAGADTLTIKSANYGVYNAVTGGGNYALKCVDGSISITASYSSASDSLFSLTSNASTITTVDAKRVTVTAEGLNVSGTGNAYALYAATGGQNIIGSAGGAPTELAISAHATGTGVWETRGIYSNGGKNILQNVTSINGSALIEAIADKGAAYAVYSNGATAETVVNGDGSTSTGLIKAESTGGGSTVAYTVTAANQSSNTFSGFKELDIKADSNGSFALAVASFANSTNTLKNIDTLNISAHNSAKTSGAVYASGSGTVEVKNVGSLNTTAASEGSSGSSRGLWATSGGVINIEADSVSASSESAYVIPGGIQGSLTAYAMYSGGANANINITADKIVLEGRSACGEGSAMYAESGGVNTLTSKTGPLDITLTSESHYQNFDYAVTAKGAGSKNVITGGKVAGVGDTITVYDSAGLRAADGGRNEITTGSGNDKLILNGAYAGPNGSNYIHAGKGDNYIKGSFHTDCGTNEIVFTGSGLNTVNGSLGTSSTTNECLNHIYNDDTLSAFNLTIGEAGKKVTISTSHKGGHNIIETTAIGKNDTFVIHGDVTTESTASYGDKDCSTEIYTRGGHDVLAIDGTVYVSANNGSTYSLIAAGGDLSQGAHLDLSAGKFHAHNSGNNYITTSTGKSDLGQGTGNDTLNITADFEATWSAVNQVHTGKGSDLVTINGDLRINNGGYNRIYTYDGNDTVTLNGDMSTGATSSSSGVNLIETGDGNDLVILNGNATVNNLGKNAINTGDGNDTLTINGAISKNGLTVNMGGGTGDTLVLQAANMTEFRGRYQEWFDNLLDSDIKNMQINELDLQIGGKSASDGLVGFEDMAWLWNRLAAYNEAVPGSRINLTVDIDHGSAGMEKAWLGAIPSGTITTGAYGDTIILCGPVTGSLVINTGGGNDRVILQAGSSAVFENYYKSWLQGGPLANVETLEVHLRDGGDLSSLPWLVQYSTDNGIDLVFTGGEGNDVFTIDQDMSARPFDIAAKDGHDTLILKAATAAEFDARYQGWLSGLTPDQLKAMGIESIKVDVNNPAGLNLGWLLTVVSQVPGIEFSGYESLSLLGTAAFTGNNGTSYAVTMTESMSVGAGVTLADGNDIIISKTITGATLNAGEGNNSIRVEGTVGAAVDSAAHIVTGSQVITGSGSDTITITGSLKGAHDSYVSGSDTLHVHGQSSVLTGDGDDFLYVEANIEGALIDMGDGHNLLDVGGSLTGQRRAFDSLWAYSDVSMGSGNDTLRVAKNLNSTNIDMGGGDNLVYVGGGFTSSALRTGSGNDHIHINNSVTAQSYIDLGDGNNLLEIIGDVVSSGISVGAGDDTIYIDKSAGGAIYTGAGDDHVWIGGAAAHSGGASGNLDINLGDGNDTLIIDGWVSGRIPHSTRNQEFAIIDAGEGDNFIEIGASVTVGHLIGGSGADHIVIGGDLRGSLVETGAGDDYLHIKGSLGDQFAMQNGHGQYIGSVIKMGAGNDTLIIDGYTGFFSGNYTQEPGEFHSIDMGDGNDYLRLNGKVNTAQITGGLGNDTLHYAFDGRMQNLEEFLEENTISGFENLIVDISANGTNDTITLDSLMSGLHGTGAETVYINGDMGDAVHGGLGQAQGTHVSGGINYDVYYHVDGLDTLTLYIQSEINKMA